MSALSDENRPDQAVQRMIDEDRGAMESVIDVAEAQGNANRLSKLINEIVELQSKIVDMTASDQDRTLLESKITEAHTISVNQAKLFARSGVAFGGND